MWSPGEDHHELCDDSASLLLKTPVPCGLLHVLCFRWVPYCTYEQWDDAQPDLQELCARHSDIADADAIAVQAIRNGYLTGCRKARALWLLRQCQTSTPRAPVAMPLILEGRRC